MWTVWIRPFYHHWNITGRFPNCLCTKRCPYSTATSLSWQCWPSFYQGSPCPLCTKTTIYSASEVSLFRKTVSIVDAMWCPQKRRRLIHFWTVPSEKAVVRNLRQLRFVGPPQSVETAGAVVVHCSLQIAVEFLRKQAKQDEIGKTLCTFAYTLQTKNTTTFSIRPRYVSDYFYKMLTFAQSNLQPIFRANVLRFFFIFNASLRVHFFGGTLSQAPRRGRGQGPPLLWEKL